MFSYKVKVYPIQNPKSKIVAYASLLIEDVFEVTGFKIFNGTNGYFVKPPQHKGKNKEGGEEWYDDVRFIGETAKDIREEVYQSVIAAFNTGARNASQATSANLKAKDNAKASNNTRTPLW